MSDRAAPARMAPPSKSASRRGAGVLVWTTPTLSLLFTQSPFWWWLVVVGGRGVDVGWNSTSTHTLPYVSALQYIPPFPECCPSPTHSPMSCLSYLLCPSTLPSLPVRGTRYATHCTTHTHTLSLSLSAPFNTLALFPIPSSVFHTALLLSSVCVCVCVFVFACTHSLRISALEIPSHSTFPPTTTLTHEKKRKERRQSLTTVLCLSVAAPHCRHSVGATQG